MPKRSSIKRPRDANQLAKARAVQEARGGMTPLNELIGGVAMIAMGTLIVRGSMGAGSWWERSLIAGWATLIAGIGLLVVWLLQMLGADIQL